MPGPPSRPTAPGDEERDDEESCGEEAERESGDGGGVTMAGLRCEREVVEERAEAGEEHECHEHPDPCGRDANHLRRNEGVTSGRLGAVLPECERGESCSAGCQEGCGQRKPAGDRSQRQSGDEAHHAHAEEDCAGGVEGCRVDAA